MDLETNVKDYDELLGYAYSGVEEPQLWHSFVDCFKKIVGARGVSIVVQSMLLQEQQSKNRYMLISTDKVSHPPEDYLQSVMTANRAIDISQPRPASLSEAVPKDTFFKSSLHPKSLERIDVKYLISVDICRTETLTVELAVERTEAHGIFTDRDKQLIEMIVSHMRRAIRFKAGMNHSTQYQSFYGKIMDKMGISYLVLDESGRLLSSNTSAHRIIDSRGGLTIREGRLVSVDATSGIELKHAINTAATAKINGYTAQSGMVMRVGTLGGPELDVVVKPIFAESMAFVERSPAVAVFVTECFENKSRMDPAALVKIYGFTKSEGKLGALLSAGMTIKEASECLKVSINTAKTHLRGIYEKTGFNRQSQIVALLNKSSIRLF